MIVVHELEKIHIKKKSLVGNVPDKALRLGKEG